MTIKESFKNSWIAKTAIAGVVSKILPKGKAEGAQGADNLRNIANRVISTATNENELYEVKISDDEPRTVNVSMHNLAVGEYKGLIGKSNHSNLNFNIEFTADGIKNEITEDNVIQVLKCASAMGGGTLFDKLFESENLSKSEKIDSAIHIIKCLEGKAAKEGFYDNIGNLVNDAMCNLGVQDENDSPNLDATKVNEILDAVNDGIGEAIKKGIIKNQGISSAVDKDFSQGEIGDCWLLASIKSIASTPKGQEILKNCIEVNKDETISVTLKGAGKTYVISRDELKETQGYSKGDGDVIALEIAMERYFNEEQLGYNNTIEEGGYMRNAYKALLGNAGSDYYNYADKEDESFFEKVDKKLSSLKQNPAANDSGKDYTYLISENQYHDLFKKVQDPNFICTVCTEEVPNIWVEGIVAQDEEGNDNQIRTHHAYSVVNSDKEYVYIINPWDTSTTLKLTHDDFMSTFHYAAMYDLNT